MEQLLQVLEVSAYYLLSAAMLYAWFSIRRYYDLIQRGGLARYAWPQGSAEPAPPVASSPAVRAVPAVRPCGAPARLALQPRPKVRAGQRAAVLVRDGDVAAAVVRLPDPRGGFSVLQCRLFMN